MKCWRCGIEIVNRFSRCEYCGTDQNRQAPRTNIGSAMRQLYDQFGAEWLLADPHRMANGIGDLVEDSGKVRNQVRMAMEAGVGQLYLDQIQKSGTMEAEFKERVQRVLTEDAGLSKKVACEIIVYFDDMIGWPQMQTVEKDPPGKKKPPVPQPPEGEEAPWIKNGNKGKHYLSSYARLCVCLGLLLLYYMTSHYCLDGSGLGDYVGIAFNYDVDTLRICMIWRMCEFSAAVIILSSVQMRLWYIHKKRKDLIVNLPTKISGCFAVASSLGGAIGVAIWFFGSNNPLQYTQIVVFLAFNSYLVGCVMTVISGIITLFTCGTGQKKEPTNSDGLFMTEKTRIQEKK